MHCQPGWEWLRYPAARAGPLFYVTDYIQQRVFHRQRAGKRSVFIADSYKNSCIENRRRIYDVYTHAMISITEVNQNFRAAAKLADKKGTLTIMKNNRPAYVLTAFKEDQITFPTSQEVEDAADKFLEKYSNDFGKMAE